MLSKETPLVDELLKALANDRKTFECNELKYIIIAIDNHLEISKHNAYCIVVKDFTSRDCDTVIFVYASNHCCEKCNRRKIKYDLEPVIAVVKSVNGDEYRIKVLHCKNCNTYSINSDELKDYEKEYGILLFERDYTYHPKLNPSSLILNDDSILSRHGYKADGSQDSRCRHSIIDFIVLKDINNAYSILEHLRNLIDYRTDCPNAQIIWDEDRKYVYDLLKPSGNIGKAELRKKCDK